MTESKRLVAGDSLFSGSFDVLGARVLPGGWLEGLIENGSRSIFATSPRYIVISKCKNAKTPS